MTAAPPVTPVGAKEAARAGLWSTLDLVIRQGFQFVVSVILARLLTPSDFGLIALLTFFTSLSIVFVQGGLATALIQSGASTHREESAVFWFNVTASVVFALVLVALRDRLARFYDQPLLSPLMIAAGAQIVLSSLGAVHGALLTRELRFRTLTQVGALSSLVSGVVGIAAAFGGWGVWALALQMVAAAGLASAGLWLFSTWRPRAEFSFASLRKLLAFGSWLSLSSTLEVIYTQGFALLLGKLYGTRQLGLYNRAVSTQLLPSNVISMVIARIALPLFTARIGEPDAVRRGVRQANGAMMLLNAPAMIGLSLLARPTIAVLYGDQWLPSAGILSILALSGLLLPLHFINLQVLLASGGSARFFRIEVFKKLVGISCLLVGSLFGIKGLAWSQLVASGVALWLNAAPTGRMLGYGPVRQLRDLAGLLPPLAAMTVAVLLVGQVAGASPFWTLVLGTVAGGISYVTTGLILNIGIFRDAITLGRQVIADRRAGATPD